MSRVFAAYSVGGLVGPALGAIGGIPRSLRGLPAAAGIGLLAARAVSAPVKRRVFEPTVPRCGCAASGSLGRGPLRRSRPGHRRRRASLDLATRLTQAEIGALYIGMSLVVSASAAAAGSLRPRPILSPRPCSSSQARCRRRRHNIPIWLLALPWPGPHRSRKHRTRSAILIERSDRADRHRDGRLVATRHHRLPPRPLAGGGLNPERRLRCARATPLAAALLLLALIAAPSEDSAEPAHLTYPPAALSRFNRQRRGRPGEVRGSAQA